MEIYENLTIGKSDFQVKICDLRQADLKFYSENPRVYSVLNVDGTEITQEEIEKHMCNLEHVKQLKTSIESNGGLIDPLIVRDGDFTVLEGNSRLAAYRLLCEKDPVIWGKVKCKVLPANISDAAIFNLLGQYHIIGRKDWDPFEQANYLYRRHKETKIPIDAMAQELGISNAKARKMIEVIEFMISKNDNKKRNWSYYEEYLKNSGIKKFRETNPDLDDTIADSIKSGAIGEASDIRKLGQVAQVGDKQSKKIMQKVANREMSIYDGYDEIQESGKLDDAIKKLKKFRNYITDDNFEKQLLSNQKNIDEAKYEINTILRRLNKIQKKIN